MRNLLLVFFLLVSIFANAQFKLTSEGFVSQADSSKRYIVYNFDGYDAKRLYTSVLKTITANYKSASDVMNNVENEMINIRGVQSKYVGIRMPFIPLYDLAYNFIIQFKDNKIRFDAPIIKCTFISDGKERELEIKGGANTYSFFKNNGNPKEKKAIERVESFFNNLVERICADIKNEDKNDDW